MSQFGPLHKLLPVLLLLDCAAHRIQMLDTIRYMIVWFPVIFTVISLMAKMFPHHHVTRHVAVAAAGRLGQSPGLVYSRHVPPPMPLDAVDVGAIAAGAH